jgi:PAS domain S-box-containing protein
MPDQALHVLLVEDNPADAELMVRELKRAGFRPQARRVETEADYLAQLSTGIDLILSDFTLPQFNGARALQLLKEKGLDIPFIIVSGTIGEETAVAAMREGADDYLLKDRPARLSEAVRHALSQKQLRDERRDAEAKLNKVMRQHELILNSTAEGIQGIDLEGHITFDNRKAIELLGWTRTELLGRPAHATIHHSHGNGTPYAIESCPIHASMRDGQTRRVTNDVFWRKDGSSFRVDYVSAPLKDDDGEIVGCIVTFTDNTEQFVAEQRLKLREEQYRLLFQTNPSSMYVFDLVTLQILAANEAACAQYGYSKEEFLKLTLRELRPTEELAELAKALGNVHSAGQFNGQFRHKRRDGSVIIVEVYSGGILWEGVAARIVTAIDVTERRKVQEELRTTHERMRELLARTPAVIYSLEIDGEAVRPTFVSENMERMLGVTPKESTGDWWLRSLHPADRERVLQTLRNALRDNGYSMEYRIRHKDGSYHWVEDKNRIMRGPTGEPKEAVGVWSDITERKRNEERLREQANIIDEAHDAIIVRNYDDLRIVFWNKGAERLYGWTAEERLGFSEVTTLADLGQVDVVIDSLRAGGEFHGELKQLTKTGQELVADVRATLVRDAEGVPRSILIVCTDITEQKKLETQLLRAQRLESIGTLASGVAHDLNNILTPILMGAETLDDHDDPDARAALDLIRASAQRGANVVKQVLTFARGIEGERVAINPRHLIEEMVDIARNTFPKSIEIMSQWTEELWSIKGDPTQLHQVLLNLSVNARDAMPNGGLLELGAENVNVDEKLAASIPDASVGPYVLLRVTDNGAGMSRETIEKIFDPFFTTKQTGHGTGLGLSTTLGIVKSHSGFLAVESEPERGTTFRIYLPAVDARPGLAETLPPKIEKGQYQSILVVDDEELIRQVTKYALEENCYHVIEAKDGPEALVVFARHADSIQLVVTDIMLPFMDGVELVRSLKKIKPDVLIIAASGEGDQQLVSRLEELGIATFLPKPYGIDKLLATVGATLQEKAGFESEPAHSGR